MRQFVSVCRQDGFDFNAANSGDGDDDDTGMPTTTTTTTTEGRETRSGNSARVSRSSSRSRDVIMTSSSCSQPDATATAAAGSSSQGKAAPSSSSSSSAPHTPVKPTASNQTTPYSKAQANNVKAKVKPENLFDFGYACNNNSSSNWSESNVKPEVKPTVKTEDLKIVDVKTETKPEVKPRPRRSSRTARSSPVDAAAAAALWNNENSRDSTTSSSHEGALRRSSRSRVNVRDVIIAATDDENSTDCAGGTAAAAATAGRSSHHDVVGGDDAADDDVCNADDIPPSMRKKRDRQGRFLSPRNSPVVFNYDDSMDVVPAADSDSTHLSAVPQQTRGRSAQDPPNPSRRLFCSDAISEEDIGRTGKGMKCNGRSPTGLSFIAYMVGVGNML